MGFWTERRQIIFGWSFLLLFTAFGAWLQAPGGAETETTRVEPALWQAILGWTAILSIYVPAYLLLWLTTSRFGWTLEEWGFGLAPRSWIAIGLAIAAVVAAWIRGAGALDQRETWTMGALEGYLRVGEELIYRGFALVFLVKTLPMKRGRAVWAVVIAAALFTLPHTHQDPMRRLNLFLGAAVPIGALTLWTRSLSLALVLHCVAGGGAVAGLVGLLFFAVMAWRARRSSRQAGAAPPGRTSPPDG